MNPESDWRPTCSASLLRLRAIMLSSVRTFFSDRGYLEVETPLLSRDIVVDAHLEPFTVTCESGSSPFFLQTSPEAGMKRLLASGTGSVFQITRSFRRNEQGHLHNPEFTIVEWYGVGTTYHEQMQLTQELVQTVSLAAGSMDQNSQHWPAPFDVISYNKAFQRAVGQNVLDLTDKELINLAETAGLMPGQPQKVDRDDLLNILLAELVEPSLGKPQPEFLCDYPISQAALAERNSADPRTACRFELYIDGLELCNGYQELTDPKELQHRDTIQNSSRTEHGSVVLPGAPRMMAAMQSGLPKCSGVALGFDRLVMAITGADSIDKVIPFPISRA